MKANPHCNHPLPACYLFIIFFLLYSSCAFSQKSKADSLRKLLAVEKKDTSRVQLLWQTADAMNKYNPDSGLIFAQDGLYLAKNIRYLEGESRSLGLLANSFRLIGNYSRALELNIQKLKIEEKRNNPRSLASVLMNIGIVYVFQEDFRQALEYYSKADSVIKKFNVEEFRYSIVLNIGDAYDRLNNSDSALIFYNQSLELARALNKNDKIGKSLTGLGHSYRKRGNYMQSLLSYQSAFPFLRDANEEETICECALGLATLYRDEKKHDSAYFYASQSLDIAKKDGFLSSELQAAEFLTDYYAKTKNVDSIFAYIGYVHDLNDSVNSKSKIREIQIIASNEQFRQRELEENRKLVQKKRMEQLQLMLIAIFIPGLFLLTLLLSRVKIHAKAVRLLGVLSLLFLFEYLTLLLHPTVARLTNHSPVFEILIFVMLAAILIPAHHRLEHWLIHKLSHLRAHHHPVTPPAPSGTGNKKSPA